MRDIRRHGAEIPDDVETDEDLLAVYQEMVDDHRVVSVKVTEKDGWHNMRVGKVLDRDDTVDPVEALEGGDADSSGTDEEEELEVGDAVTFKHGGKAMSGEIVSFNEDDDTVSIKVAGKRRPVVVPFDDDVQLADGDDEPEAGDDADAPDGGAKEYEYNEGDAVMVTWPDGEEYAAQVISAGTDQIEVQYDDDDTTEVVAGSIVRLADEEEVDDEGDEGEEDDEEGAEEEIEEEDEGDEEEADAEVGDLVTFKVGTKKLKGTVASIAASKNTMRVKVGSKVHTVKLDQFEFAEA